MGSLCPFSLPRPPIPPSLAEGPVPQHLRTREADGTGGRAESPVHAGNCVPYKAAQHSVIQTQAAAGVVRHHFAEQVPGTGERDLSTGPGLQTPGREGNEGQAIGCLPVLEPHHGDLRSWLPDVQTGVCVPAGGQWEVSLRSFAATQRWMQDRKVEL